MATTHSTNTSVAVRQTPQKSSNPDTGYERSSTKECERIRSAITEKLRSAVGRDTVLIDRDVQDYMQYLTDEELEAQGKKTAEEKLRHLQKVEREYVQERINEARHFWNRLNETISSSKQALNTKNIEHIYEKIQKRRGSWVDVWAFFNSDQPKENLQKWTENWSKIAEKLQEVDKVQQQLGLANDSLPALKKFHDRDKSESVLGRLKLLDDALDELKNEQELQAALEKEGKQTLQKVAAQNANIMNDAKIQRFLKEKFEKYKGEARVQYIRGTLPLHARKWLEEGYQFQKESEKARKRGANPLSEREFFSLSYAERRETFTSLQSENAHAESPVHSPLLSQAQTLIDTDEWDKAETLIRQTEFSVLSAQDQRRIFDLRQQIRMERETASALQKTAANDKQQSPMEDVIQKRTELRNALMSQPESIRAYYQWALEAGGPLKWMRMRRLRVWHYNVAWAHANGFMDDENEFMQLQQDAEQDTEKINKDGHRERGVEKIQVGQASRGVEGTNRKFASGKSRGATWHVFGKNNMEEMRLCIDDELDNGQKTYWGLMKPEGVTLKQTLDGFHLLNPKIKALQNAEAAAGGLVSQEALFLGQTMPAR